MQTCIYMYVIVVSWFYCVCVMSVFSIVLQHQLPVLLNTPHKALQKTHHPNKVGLLITMYLFRCLMYTSCKHVISDERPSLPKLLCFRTNTGTTINIMSRVGTHYTDLGLILLDDEDGALVEAITSQFHENAVKITREILMQWIRGEGIQPVTWKTLIDTLRDIGLTELATSIHDSLL